jgi:hypothetical protein
MSNILSLSATEDLIKVVRENEDGCGMVSVVHEVV